MAAPAAGRLDGRVGDLLGRHRHALAASVVSPAPVTAQVMKTSAVHSRPTDISCAARSAARPSAGSRPRVTRWLGPQMLTITTGRPRGSSTAADTPLE